MVASPSMHGLDRVRDVNQDLQFAPKEVADGQEEQGSHKEQGSHVHAQLVNITDSSRALHLTS